MLRAAPKLLTLYTLTRHLLTLSVYYIHIYNPHTRTHTRMQLGATFHGGDHLIAYPWGDFIHCPTANYGCKRTPSDERTDYMSPVSCSLPLCLARAISLSLCMYVGKGGLTSTSYVMQGKSSGSEALSPLQAQALNTTTASPQPLAHPQRLC